MGVAGSDALIPASRRGLGDFVRGKGRMREVGLMQRRRAAKEGATPPHHPFPHFASFRWLRVRQARCIDMRFIPLFVVVLGGLLASHPSSAREPRLPGIGDAMESMVQNREIAGAVTMVVGPRWVLHLETTGYAEVATQKPMRKDTLFWIASMTKPITGTAVLMLQDEGKLAVSDLVEKYLPEFADLKTPSGQPAHLTIAQLLNHTSGLGEASGPSAQQAQTLADLVPIWLAAPMQFEPGTQWRYTQSAINAAGRVVEAVSGMTFDQFLKKRLFDPLGMKHTTFYLAAADQKRLVTAYAKNKETGNLEPVPPRPEFGPAERPPQGNGGLYSTAPDYARFCQMLLNGGTSRGRRYLSTEAMSYLTRSQTGNLPTGFFQSEAYGRLGHHYSWGLGTCILMAPHGGVAERLSRGTFGHGGAWGTQAWIDPVRGVAYLLMVQRSNFPNSDASEVRRVFQDAAAQALTAGATK
jgi:CubicO group peptidase (beta-lactamase class C family)